MFIPKNFPKPGDVYWIDPNPASAVEAKDKHCFAVITPHEINSLGIAMAVPITPNKAPKKSTGITVAIVTEKTQGLAVCNQVRSFDMQARIELGNAGYVETLNGDLISEIRNRVLSVIEPSATT